MPDLFDYVAWRGDLEFSQDGLNPVDNLLLSCLSYIHFEDFLLSQSDEPVTVAQAAERLMEIPAKEREALMRTKRDEELLSRLALTKRFGGLRLENPTGHTDPVLEKQFAAVTVRLGDIGAYVAFRGTDSTLVGWKEDFNMAFLPVVPAQADAAAYLEEAARRFDGPLWVGGHSKGGNLAVFAAANSSGEVRTRIRQVFNNDGPGFGASMMESRGYLEILPKLSTFLPQSSIVGMLLEHEEDYTVVHSRQVGIMQHDPYSWEVLGGDFIRLEQITSTSRILDRTLKDWVRQMSQQQREEFLNTLFRLFAVGDARTLAELPGAWIKNFDQVRQEWRDTSPQTRQLLQRTFGQLMQAARHSLSEEAPMACAPSKNAHGWIFPQEKFI